MQPTHSEILRAPLREASTISGEMRRTRMRRTRMRRIKRIMLALVLAAQPLGYRLLAETRYLGQGLPTSFFRFSTTSDLLSILLTCTASLLIILAILRPERISLGRTITAFIFTGILLWLDFGLLRMDPNDFSPVAGIAMILSTCALLAVLGTRSRPTNSNSLRIWKIIRNTLLTLLLLTTFAFGYAFLFPTYTGLQEITNFNPDAGVVLGAAVWRGRGLGERASPTLHERIDVGYDLLAKSAIPRLVLTGSNAPGELPESEIARRELLRRGVDPGQIISETHTHTSLEQVRYLHDELFAKQGWSRFVIISDQYHLARVIEMCRFSGLVAIGSPSRIHQPFLDLLYYRLRESFALLEYWILGR